MTAPEISWAPSRTVFLRRVSVIAAVTYSALAAVALVLTIYYGVPLIWSLLGALAFTAGFAIDDLLRWRNARLDRWQISEGQLIHDGADGRAQIPLSEIVSARAALGNRVIVKLTSGQRIPIRYLPYPDATARQLDAARIPDAQRSAGGATE